MNALEQLSKVSVAKKIGVLGVFVVLLAVGYWFLYYSVVSEELAKLESEHKSLLSRREAATRRKATYEKDRERRDELKKSYGLQLRALPTDAEMSSFLAALNTQAELVGLKLLSVKPEKEEPAEYYARIPVRLKLEGTFHQLAKFFYLVGSLDRIINIENISLNVASAADSEVLLNATVLATTFRSVQSKGSQGAPAKKGAKRKKT